MLMQQLRHCKRMIDIGVVLATRPVMCGDRHPERAVEQVRSPNPLWSFDPIGHRGHPANLGS
jgi:hypothetical protein